MSVIRCPNCGHNALYIDTEVLASKNNGDIIKGNEVKIIHHMSGMRDGVSGEAIEYSKCKSNLWEPLHMAWKEAKELSLVREWDK
jgi:hypothetical protein